MVGTNQSLMQKWWHLWWEFTGHVNQALLVAFMVADHDLSIKCNCNISGGKYDLSIKYSDGIFWQQNVVMTAGKY